MKFLPSRDPRPFTLEAPPGFEPVGLYLGPGAMALEVAALRASRRPTNPELRQLYQERLGKRATPVMVVVQWGNERAALCGPSGDDLAMVADADRTQIERICEAALAAPDRHAALRFLATALGQLGSPIPGLRNSGLFAFHFLEHGVPERPDWGASTAKARGALSLRSHKLIEALGFRIQQLQGPESILVANGTKVAIALFLERADEIEPASPQFGGISPVSHALAKADQENLDYVVIAAGGTLRIYPVKTGVGTGRRGRTETFIEVNLDVLAPAQAGYLWLLYSAEALGSAGSFTTILGKSEDYAADLGTRLRERVYQEVVPQLADALVHAQRLRKPSPEKLRKTYEMSLLVLFRLLFVAYAEDNDRLPLHSNPTYRKHSLKELAKQLGDTLAKRGEFEPRDFYWTEVSQLWKAVDGGNKAWGVSAYNGGLFAGDEGAGAELAKLSVPDRDFAPALAALLLDETDEGTQGPIDFRPLGVREFGTIYEGLLESELSVAETDLAVDPKSGAYLPAAGRAKVEVRGGEVYLHNASGARKSTGSYYTKSFAVDHLLDNALEPALSHHLARLDALYDAREAAEQFFDFRVADVAMGSGHFLVAAVDRVERRLSNYMAKRPLAGVADELERLRKSAVESLGQEWSGDPIEDTQLLRRQIARRCIFGVDLNPLAVELARLSLWIHTFVPGLPLSFLDANLVLGNSLVGIATFEEAREVLGAGLSLFETSAEEMLGVIRPLVKKFGHLADADAAEVREAKRLHLEMRDRIEHVSGLLDLVTASRLDDSIREKVDSAVVGKLQTEQGDAFTDSLVQRARKILTGLHALHFPIAFPQVFLGKRGAFDVVLGNPPWEKVKLEEHEFWGRHYPGFRGLSQTERERRLPSIKRTRPDLVSAYEDELARTAAMRAILLRGPFPGLGTGDPDLYKAFCWRFWQLVSEDGGCIGVVLPRAVFAAKGSEEFRRTLFNDPGSASVTMLLNTKGWAFDTAEPRYTIALVAIMRGKAPTPQELALSGPYANLPAFMAARTRETPRFPYSAVRSWTDSFALPLLPTEGSATVFTKIRRSPRLDAADDRQWVARPHRELDSTLDKEWFTFDANPDGKLWPVYAGESFDLWIGDTGKYYAVAEWRSLTVELQKRRASSLGRTRSPFSGFAPDAVKDARTLPCMRARVAFRRISRATDSRTVRVALVPPRVVLVDTAPYLLWPKGGEQDEALMLGVLSSLPLDWYSRRFVETHLDFHVFHALPIPIVNRSSKLAKRTVQCAARLAAQDDRFGSWAEAFSLKPRRLKADEQQDLIAELDATVAHLYGLAEADLVHIFETFHRGWEYDERLDATLKHFRKLKSLA